MSANQNIRRPDGKDCPVYLATPKEKARGAVVVIQEWWGLNPQIKATADRLAAAGYQALVPDLYRGKLAKDADEAHHFMGGLDFLDATEQDIRGSAQHLRAAGAAKVGVIGFCMGGALTIVSGLKVPEMSAGVCFYGIPPAQVGDPGQIKAPLQCHFANTDDWCTPKAIDELEAKLKKGGVTYEIHRYDAQHAFMNEKRPEVYDAACAELAWQRALAFLGQYVG